MSAAPLTVGDVIHGFAEGAFGRDSYECRRVEAVGPDWIVTRNSLGFLALADGADDLRRCQRSRDTACTRTNVFDEPHCPFAGENSRLTAYPG